MTIIFPVMEERRGSCTQLQTILIPQPTHLLYSSFNVPSIELSLWSFFLLYFGLLDLDISIIQYCCKVKVCYGSLLLYICVRYFRSWQFIISTFYTLHYTLYVGKLDNGKTFEPWGPSKHKHPLYLNWYSHWRYWGYTLAVTGLMKDPHLAAQWSGCHHPAPAWGWCWKLAAGRVDSPPRICPWCCSGGRQRNKWGEMYFKPLQ